MWLRAQFHATVPREKSAAVIIAPTGTMRCGDSDWHPKGLTKRATDWIPGIHFGGLLFHQVDTWLCLSEVLVELAVPMPV